MPINSPFIPNPQRPKSVVTTDGEKLTLRRCVKCEKAFYEKEERKNSLPRLSGKETKMKRVFVDMLNAGVDGTEQYGMDASGNVFRVDKDGESHEVSEAVAKNIRQKIKAADEINNRPKS